MERHEVARTTELVEGKGKCVRLPGVELAVFRVGDGFRAYRNLCPHAGAPICGGPVSGTVLRCPWHGWEFDLRTGAHVTHPATALESFAVEVVGDRLFVLA